MSVSIRKPVHSKVARVPVILQLEVLECGAAALAMVMAYYGKWVPLEQVRLDCGVSRNGSNAKNIYQAAKNYGFDVQALRTSPEQLQKDGTFPCIIHWNMNHFVVLDGFKGKYVWINDPARGTLKITLEEFDRSFTGVAIIPVPSDHFEPGGKRKSIIGLVRKRLHGAAPAVVFVMLTTMIAYLFNIIHAVTSRVFLDRLLTGSNSDWLVPFFILLAAMTVIELTVQSIRTISSLRINGKLAISGAASYMWKVLRLPMDFFAQRLSGDIQSRQSLNEKIASSLVNTLAPLVLNCAMMVFYLGLMLKQSVLLSVIGLSALLVNMIVSQIIIGKRVNIARVQMRDAGKLESATVGGIGMIETIKASGAENAFFARWSGYQAAVNAGQVSSDTSADRLGMIPALFAAAANYMVLILGVRLTMNGQFTLGAVYMFQGFLSSFMGPAASLVLAGQTIQETRTQVERIEDVMEYPEDPALKERTGSAEMPYRKLKGEIELKNITFGYSRLEEPLISDFSLHIMPGEKIALVGASGCGKSTVSKLISGLYEPWSGEILFDGLPKQDYPREIINGSLAVVDQDIILFEDTVANNISMWDPTILDFEMILAARDAQIHDDIMRMDGGYKHKILSDGRNLSGGQRQRMEIARVLAMDPSIIILDEATSALDAQTEYDVVKAISERGITCIVVAHRLSTIRDCDRILVLDQGRLAEWGTHEQLMEKGGLYTSLVTSE